MARLSPFWGNTMSQVRRDAWDLYGDNVQMTNALGLPIYLTGQNHFMRTNVPRIQAGISITQIAPVIFDLGSFTAPTIVGLIGIGNQVSVGFDNTDAWANSVNGYLLLWSGRPVNVSHEYFGGPYRYAGLIQGNPVPPASPQPIVGPWRWNEESRFWFYARIIQPDGRMSSPIYMGPIEK